MNNIDAAKKLQIELLPKQPWYMLATVEHDSTDAVTLYVASYAPADLTPLKAIVAPHRLIVKRSPKQQPQEI